jgi:hypothetical protein
MLANDADTRARFARVARLIEGFETPFGMELLATVHWVPIRVPCSRSLPSCLFAVSSTPPESHANRGAIFGI